MSITLNVQGNLPWRKNASPEDLTSDPLYYKSDALPIELTWQQGT